MRVLRLAAGAAPDHIPRQHPDRRDRREGAAGAGTVSAGGGVPAEGPGRRGTVGARPARCRRRGAAALRRPKLLQTRVTLNKLALPPEANFVYVSEPPEKIVSAGHEFAAVLSLSDPDVINELKSIAAAPRRSLRQADIITFRQLAE